MTTEKENQPAAERDVAPSYQPVALKAVLAAALMLKRPTAKTPRKAA